MTSELCKPYRQTFERILILGKEDGKDLAAMGLKLMEEVGELAECMNHHLGNLPHKTMKEPLINEAADVIQNVVAILSKVYPNSTFESILDELSKALESKTDKWESVMFKKPV